MIRFLATYKGGDTFIFFLDMESEVMWHYWERFRYTVVLSRRASERKDIVLGEIRSWRWSVKNTHLAGYEELYLIIPSKMNQWPASDSQLTRSRIVHALS